MELITFKSYTPRHIMIHKMHKYFSVIIKWSHHPAIKLTMVSKNLDDEEANPVLRSSQEKPLLNAYYEDPTLNEPPAIAAKKEPLWRATINYAYPYFIIEHLTVKDTKVIIRSWIQLFAGVIFTAVTVLSTWLGNAPYLLQIFSFFVPSGGMLVALSVYMQLAVFLGSLCGLVFGVVTMKINNAIHGNITIRELAAALIKEGACENDATLPVCLTAQIYTGRYLNVKVAAVTSVALIAAKVFFGMLSQKGYIPRVTFIAGLISSVVFIASGVFWPVFDPLPILYTLLKPIGISCVLGISCSILFWPHSTSWQMLNANWGIFQLLRLENGNHFRFFTTMKPSLGNFLNYKNLRNNAQALKNQMLPIGILNGIMQFDFSYGRFDRDEVNQFYLQVKALLSITAGYDYFYELFEERKEWAVTGRSLALSRRNTTASTTSAVTSGSAKLFTIVYQSYKKVGEFERKKRSALLRKRLHNEDGLNYLTLEDLDDTAALIIKHCSPCLSVTNDGFAAILQWMEDANAFRTYSIFGGYAGHVKKQKENAQLLLTTKQEILEHLEKLSDKAALEKLVVGTKRNEDVLLFIVSQVAMFSHLLRSHCIHLIAMIDFLVEIDGKRPKPKLMTPFTHTKSSEPAKDIDEQRRVFKSRIQQRNPDAETPSRLYQKFGVLFNKLYGALSDRTLWFFIRSGALVVAAATPYFVRTTAHWYYDNRLLWIVVMVMMNDSELTGDSVYNYINRVFFTFVGSLVGMVAWYICQGNAYGYVAVSGVVFVYFIYYRHFSIHLTVLPSILFGLTSSLVLGTSYYNHVHPEYASIGEGFHVAWIRLVSVIIGLSIAFIGCLLPRPHTSTSVHRKKLAGLISLTGELHCLVSKFACHRRENPDFKAVLKGYILVEKFNDTFKVISGLDALGVALKNELPLTGYWPEATYKKLQSLLYDVVLLYYLIFALLNEVEDPRDWNEIMIKRMGWANSSILSAFFANIHMSADALLTKQGLPKVTASNLSIQHLDLLGRQWRTDNPLEESLVDMGSEKSEKQESVNTDSNTSSGGSNTQVLLDEVPKPEVMVESDSDVSLDDSIMSGDYTDYPIGLTNENVMLNRVSTRIQKSILKNLDFDRLFSRDGQLTTTSLLFAHLIYERVDEIMLLVKSLVGEKYDLDVGAFDDFNESTTLFG